jgi:myo-inositol-1(or 4)-monophosphatase
MHVQDNPTRWAALDNHLRNELREFLRDLVGIAARGSLTYFRREIAVENKREDRFDPVTIADRETEDLLRAAIQKRYPTHGIIGEERTAHNPTARMQWVIDPIDGTKAYLCGLPTWATLIGLCDNGRPVLGLMSQPVVGEYFIGGYNAASNVTHSGEVVIRTSNIVDLTQSFVFATSPEMFAPDTELPRFQALSAKTRMTRYGVDSYAYCLLAAGYVDIVAEAGLGFYDIAALIPIIEAAGGVVSDWEGAPVRGGGTVVAAANATLHRAALAALAN